MSAAEEWGPLLGKIAGGIMIAIASYAGGETLGESRGQASGIYETQTQLVAPTVVLHLSTVIADLTDQLEESQRRDCATR